MASGSELHGDRLQLPDKEEDEEEEEREDKHLPLHHPDDQPQASACYDDLLKRCLGKVKRDGTDQHQELEKDQQDVEVQVKAGTSHLVVVVEPEAEATEIELTEVQLEEDGQLDESERPTTSTKASPAAAAAAAATLEAAKSRTSWSVLEAQALVAAVLQGAQVPYDHSRYLPVAEQAGAGTYRVHNIPAKLLESLPTHEIAAVWPLLKNEIGKKIWGTEKFEPVPTVVEGAVDRYELGAVLFKSNLTPKERWRCLPPKCQAVASIYDLIWDHDLSPEAAVDMAAPLRIKKASPWPNHRFHGLVLKGGYCRQVVVTVTGCHRVVPRALPRPDSLVLNLYRYSGRYRTNRIYVISEVIYAEELHVSVRVSINRDDIKILHRVPIAFKLHVYDVRDLSTLIQRRPYDKPLRVRWTGLTDTEQPSTYPRRARGMGDVNKRLDLNRRTANGGLELFPNRNPRVRSVDNGGDRHVQVNIGAPH